VLEIKNLALKFNGIHLYHERLRRGELTVRQEVLRCLNIIEGKQQLNAFLEVYRDEALRRADELDIAISKGEISALTGVVVGIKDNICYSGHQVSAGSRILDGFVSLYSATVVERLLESGAIIIGRLNCDEFAMGSSNENSAYGPVLNPLHEAKVPGGSSGGSAAAVAMGGCHVSLGTDTGGSVRQPASFCGLVGIKPTYGRISRHGIVAFASSFDQVGVFAHSVDDAAMITEVISGKDDKDSTCTADVHDSLYTRFKDTSYPKQRLAYCPRWMEDKSLSPEFKELWSIFIAKCREAGHELVPVDIEGLEYAIPVYYILATAEASSNLSRYSGLHFGYRDSLAESLESTFKSSRSQGFGLEVQRRIMLGTFVLSEGYYEAYYSKAQKVRRLFTDRFKNVLLENDVLLSPTVAGVAFGIGEKASDPLQMYLEDQFTVLANLTGLPAMSMPLGRGQNDLPLGLQLTVSPWAEAKMFALGRQLESIISFI